MGWKLENTLVEWFWLRSPLRLQSPKDEAGAGGAASKMVAYMAGGLDSCSWGFLMELPEGTYDTATGERRERE